MSNDKPTLQEIAAHLLSRINDLSPARWGHGNTTAANTREVAIKAVSVILHNIPTADAKDLLIAAGWDPNALHGRFAH